MAANRSRWSGSSQAQVNDVHAVLTAQQRPASYSDRSRERIVRGARVTEDLTA
jgi:hypothetical protein